MRTAIHIQKDLQPQRSHLDDFVGGETLSLAAS